MPEFLVFVGKRKNSGHLIFQYLCTEGTINIAYTTAATGTFFGEYGIGNPNIS